jgi:3',5'-cyclic AMP phosphodiesterase CpdA
MIRIIHVSDLHFGKTKDQTKKCQRLLKNVLKQFPPDKDTYFIITGDIIDNWDIAKDAWKNQYKLAVEALAAFKPNVFVVPGNHDYGFGGFGYSKKFADYFDNSFLPSVEIKHKFGTKRPWRQILDDGQGTKVLLIGLNSCLMTPSPLDIAKGEIGEKQRSALDGFLSDSADKVIPKIVYLHHIPHRRAEGIGMSLIDYKELMNVVRNRVNVLAFGHEGSMKDPESRKAKVPQLPPRPMKIRRGPSQGIKYYLDANTSVKKQSCYCVEVNGSTVTAQLIKC